MRSSSLFWTILAASAPSQAIDASWGNIGVGSSPGPWLLEEGYKKGEEAGRRPNATRAVTFDRQYENNQETWGWRINITELAIPNNPNQFGNASANSSENHRVTNTQWQLTWPGNENNFNEFLKKRNVRASFAGYIGNKPSNVTNGFNASSTNGDCTALLGAECVAGLKRGAVGTTLKITGNQGCEDTLDLRDADGASFYNSAIGWSTNGTVADLSNNTRFGNDERENLTRDGTFYYQTTPYYDAGNTTFFDQTKGAVQILVFRLNDNNATQNGGVIRDEPSILCQIVEKGAEKTGAAVGWTVSMAGVWGVAVASALLVMW